MVNLLACLLAFAYILAIPGAYLYNYEKPGRNVIKAIVLAMYVGIFVVFGILVKTNPIVEKETKYVTAHVTQKVINSEGTEYTVTFVEDGKTYNANVPKDEYRQTIALYKTTSITFLGKETEELEYSWRRPAGEN